nr:MAG TPA: hypothetical protein [Caudoviricetes sp.]
MHIALLFAIEIYENSTRNMNSFPNKRITQRREKWEN